MEGAVSTEAHNHCDKSNDDNAYSVVDFATGYGRERRASQDTINNTEAGYGTEVECDYEGYQVISKTLSETLHPGLFDEKGSYPKVYLA